MKYNWHFNKLNLFSNKKKLTNSWTYFTEFIIGNTLHAWIIRWCNHINVYSAMFACLNLIWFKIKIAQYLHNIQIFANEDSLFWLWAMNIPWIDWHDVKRSGSENKQQSFGYLAHTHVWMWLCRRPVRTGRNWVKGIR